MAQINPIDPSESRNVEIKAPEEVPKCVNGTNLQDKVALEVLLSLD